MADQRSWFKTWTSILANGKFAELSLEDVGRWTFLMAAVALDGESGKLVVHGSGRELLRVLRVDDFQEAAEALRRLPNVDFEAYNDPTTATHKKAYSIKSVQILNWYSYQVDSRRLESRSRTAKKRREDLPRKIPPRAELPFEALPTPGTSPGDFPSDPEPRSPGNRPRKGRGSPSASDCSDCRHVLGVLNELAGRRYEGSKKTLGLVHARHLKHGVEKCERVIRIMCWKRLGTELEEYLRPETLFNETKFDSYVNQSLPPAPPRRTFDPYNPAEVAEREKFRERYRHLTADRISPDRRKAGIDFLKGSIADVESKLAAGEGVAAKKPGEIFGPAPNDLDALAKRLSDLKAELAFLEGDA